MLIPIAHIEPELEASDRYEAIGELLTRLVHAGAIARSAQPDLFAAFSQREDIMSTGIGFRLAIPHIGSDRVARTLVAFGRSRVGIEFDSLDNAPVEFVFLFIMPAAKFAEQARTRSLARICRALANARVQTRLRGCSAAEEIGEVLENAFNNDDH